MSVKRVLHIAPHLGAGIGTVVLALVGKLCHDHEVMCLGYVDSRAVEMAWSAGVSLRGNVGAADILARIAAADIVIVHFWNHPLLIDFLVRAELPPCRLIFWAHTSGANAPNNFTEKFLRYPDRFIFTTPLSHLVNEVRRLTPREQARLGVIWSTGGVDRPASNVRAMTRKHRGFTVGYVGNVDFAKMHPEFLAMSAAADIPDVKFVVIGAPNGDAMRREAESRGLGDKFEFTGFVSEAEKWERLASFDAFGYPLNPRHYGTCDQALQEAMGAGIPPVVLANPMEAFMVRDGGTGIVARDVADYPRALERLYRDKTMRARMSTAARLYAIGEFSTERMAADWNEVIEDAAGHEKRARTWDIAIPKGEIAARDVFMEALGPYGEDFSAWIGAPNACMREDAESRIADLARCPTWRSKSKGSVHQYDAALPGDPMLARWSELMADHA